MLSALLPPFYRALIVYFTLTFFLHEQSGPSYRNGSSCVCRFQLFFYYETVILKMSFPRERGIAAPE